MGGIKRNLAKINYGIHTDVIRETLILKELSKTQIDHVYTSESDFLNVALIGITAKERREANPDKTDNI